jgi:hypothetical protein
MRGCTIEELIVGNERFDVLVRHLNDDIAWNDLRFLLGQDTCQGQQQEKNAENVSHLIWNDLMT